LDCCLANGGTAAELDAQVLETGSPQHLPEGEEQADGSQSKARKRVPSIEVSENADIVELVMSNETDQGRHSSLVPLSPMSSGPFPPGTPSARSNTTIRIDESEGMMSFRTTSTKSLRTSATRDVLVKLEVPVALRRGSEVQDYTFEIKADYEIEEELGHGGFGSVFVGRSKKDQSKVAVKLIPRARLKKMESFQQEVEHTKRLAHPNIIRLFASYRDDTNYYLVMELCRGGSLAELVQESGLHKDELGLWSVGLPGEMIARYAWQMLSGAAYLHYFQIVHRDIKLENYMKVTKEEYAQIKLIDMGLATMIKKDGKLTDMVGTVLTMAPEVRQRSYDEKVDVWGIGICLYMCAVAMDPWFSEEEQKQFEEDEIFEALDDPGLQMRYYERRWSLKEPEVRQLVSSLLVVNPSRRPKARDVLSDNKWLRAFGRPGANCCCAIA